MRDDKRVNLDRKPMSRQWYGGILSYAAASLLIDLQTEKVERIRLEKSRE